MKFTLGRKVAMTQFFGEDGRAHAATIVEAGPTTVTQVKTTDRDGYSAVQVGFGSRKVKNIAKAQRVQWNDAAYEVVREFQPNGEAEFVPGTVLSIKDMFAPGDTVQVAGTSKGKGFQGVVKRHGFAGGRRTHGQKHSEREPGSIGATGPQRVFKGTRMAGRMGGDRVTVKNLKVLAVDPATNQMIIKGAVPGRRGTILEITSTN